MSSWKIWKSTKKNKLKGKGHFNSDVSEVFVQFTDCCYCSCLFFWLFLLSVAFFSVLARLYCKFRYFFHHRYWPEWTEGQSEKSKSAYKWIKQNWKKIFVILFAIFALIVVMLIEVRFCGDHGRVFFFLQTTHLAPWLQRSVLKIPKMKY